MDMSSRSGLSPSTLDVDVTSSERLPSKRERVRQAASGAETWIQNVGVGAAEVPDAGIYFVKKSWTTRFAYPVGVLIFLLGIPPTLSLITGFFGGLLTAGSPHNLSRNASFEAHVGRAFGRGTVTVLSAFSNGVSASYRAMEVDDRQEETPRRISTVSDRRPRPYQD